MTVVDAPEPAVGWGALLAPLERDPAFDPHVPGIPGDGSPVVLHVDTARGLTFTWYDISRRKQDWNSRSRGYLVSRLEVTDVTGEVVGYLNVTHTTPELVAVQLPTSLHWADENIGTSFGYRYGEVTPQRLWAAAWQALREFPPSTRGRGLWVLSASDAPEDLGVLVRELDEAEKKLAKQVAKFVKHLQTPIVDYAHLDVHHVDPWGQRALLRGTGVGRFMYLTAARRLAEQGKVLRASGVQSDAAQALWARLVADPQVPTRDVEVEMRSGKRAVYPCVDFADASRG